MANVTITRTSSDETGTYGTLVCENGFTCLTLEPQNPIDPGTYQVDWQWSPDHEAYNYRLQNVPNHTGIEIHSGNTHFDTLDCILLGRVLTIFNPGAFPNIKVPLKGINDSRETVAEFESEMLTAPFTLTIC